MDENLSKDADQPIADEGLSSEDAACAVQEKELSERENMPLASKQDANSQVREEIERFTRQFPDSTGLFEEMADEIEKHPEWEADNALINAYVSVLSKTRKTAEEFLSDEEFVREKVLSNPKLREKIISECFSGTDGVKLPLGRGIPAASANKPKSIEDAGRLLEELLK